MVIKNKAVRVVVAYYNAPPLAKGNNLLKELPAAIRPTGAIVLVSKRIDLPFCVNNNSCSSNKVGKLIAITK